MNGSHNKRDQVLVRPAWIDEGPVLTELAFQSKAHWGYDSDFMARCRAELTITTDRIGRERIRVAEQRGTLLGFSALAFSGDEAEVLDVFVHPAHIGSDAGRLLMEDLLNYAAKHGLRLVRVESDPNAASFYESMGFRQIGEAPSGSIPGRVLPLMEIRLKAA